jgi:hypothetical protein
MEIAHNGAEAFRETEEVFARHNVLIANIKDELDSLKSRVSALEENPPDQPVTKPFVFFDDFQGHATGQRPPENIYITDAPSGHCEVVFFNNALKAMKCLIQKRQPLNRNGHCKSEFRLRNPEVTNWKDTLREPFNERRWYSWTHFLFSPWQYDPHKTHLMDIHGSPDDDEGGRHPNVTLLAWHGKHRIRVSWNPEELDSSNPHVEELFREPPVLSGMWLQCTIEAIWSHQSNGLFRFWMGDRLVAERVGEPTAFNDQKGPYLKLGLYAPSLSQNIRAQYEGDYPDAWQNVMYIREIRIGRGEDFASREEFLSAKPAQ